MTGRVKQAGSELFSQLNHTLITNAPEDVTKDQKFIKIITARYAYPARTHAQVQFLDAHAVFPVGVWQGRWPSTNPGARRLTPASAWSPLVAMCGGLWAAIG
jgi:hypothetical protein